MTARLIDVIGLPTPEQARRIVVRLGLAGGVRHDNGAGAATPTPRAKTVHQQAS